MTDQTIKPLLKDLIGGNKTAKLTHYRNGSLFYETTDGFKFEVPTTDCGDTEFPAEGRAGMYMKWIKRQLDNV